MRRFEPRDKLELREKRDKIGRLQLYKNRHNIMTSSPIIRFRK